MNTREHLVEIPILTPQSTKKECLDVMLDVECFELPVVREGRIFGKITLEDCLDEKGTIESSIERGFPTIHLSTHLFDVMNVFRQMHASVCGVVDDSSDLKGVISKEMVMNRLSHSISVEQNGSIILVEMASQQYSSSEVARIVEGENAQILGLWLEQVGDSGRIRISIKVNTVNAERIVNSFLRFNYEVLATFGDLDYQDGVEKRYQSLMKYLDI